MTLTWVGLSDLEMEGVWRWEDGYVLQWAEWRNKAPDGGATYNCAIRDADGVYVDQPCDIVPQFAVCEYEKGTAKLVKEKNTSS